METKVYCNHIGFEGELLPTFFVLEFKENLIPWKEERLDVDVLGPYQKLNPEDIPEDIPSASVFIEDLTINSYHRNGFSINLPRLYERIYNQGFDPTEIRQLVLLIDNVEEVLCSRLLYVE